jgi:protein O-GlcNAc transferase
MSQHNGPPAPDAPDSYTQWLEQGVTLRQRGDLAGALDCYRAATQAAEAGTPAFFNLGNVLLDLGRWAEAKVAFAQVLERDPQTAAAWLQMARCEVRLGVFKAAREAFAAVLRLEPENFSAWLEAGHLCRHMGLPDQALASYRKAVDSATGRWEGHLALARALEDAGQWDAGAAHYHRALDAASAQPATVRHLHTLMARYRLERGDPARALESLRQALGLLGLEQPDPGVDVRADLLTDLGDILMRLGLQEQAYRAFESASSATDEAVLTRLAQVSFQHNLWREAQDVLKRSVQLHPASNAALWNLAHAYAESWQLEEAEQTLAQAERIRPQPGAASMRASIAGKLGDADRARQLYQALAEEDGPRSPLRSSAAMASLYSDTLSATEVAALHRELFAPMGEGARAVDSFQNTREPQRRIRLGLISADFHHQHPVNIFMQPVLARLDKKKFEVFTYFTGTSHDDQTQLARSRSGHWVACTSFSNVQLARRIEADRIDLMLDLSGHTSHNRMAMLAQRVAPVQATFLGYPGSTGVPNIDWLLADPVVAPPGSEALFSEQVMRLPHSVFCYAPEADYPYPAYTDAHRDRPLTFGSFNNVSKLTPHTIALWARLLQALPKARLLLKAPSFKDEMATRLFRSRFEQAGVAPERIEFRGPTGLQHMMAEYADVDIALDTVPYNGGTTSLQALWMGVPVVVKAGQHFVSRMGQSFMTAAGLQDWIAPDDDAYVALAVQKALDRAALLRLKQGLRKRLQGLPGWNIDLYTRDLEAALRHMWQVHCEKT